MADIFRRFAHHASVALGTVWAFLAALAVIIVWAITGPAAGFSQAWQLIINTGTTIVTFLMVFIIQNTQNRDARAIHLKLDELIDAIAEAREEMVDLEDAPEEELEQLQEQFAAKRANGNVGSAGRSPESTPAARAR